MPLTAKEVRNAKPGRHSDGGGLYLLVKPSGAASWVLRVQYQGERKDFGLGSMVLDSAGGDIPIDRRKLLTLAEAREKARLGRALAKAGINPPEHWRAAAQPKEPPPSFRIVAEQVHGKNKGGWKNARHRGEWLSSLKRYAFPVIGDLPVADVDATAIEKVLLPIWLSKPETARRVKQRIGIILDEAHAKGWRSTEAPMRSVNQLLKIKQPKGRNFAAMPYAEVPAFVGTLRGQETVGRLALQFQILTAVRPGEVRHALWKEIDLDAAEWRIPAEKMKAGKEHIIPLVPAAIELLKRAAELFGNKPGAVVFPGHKGKPLSDMTLLKVLRDLKQPYTAHGFRSSFRDWAAEHGFANDWCEAALAHTVAGQEGKTAASYKRTSFYQHRREKLMPAWASFVLSNRSNVVQLAASRA
jgi:integrase